MGMTDVLGFMKPGEAYSFDDICESLESNGCWVTNTDTVKEALYRLHQRGDLVAVSGFYIRTYSERDPDELKGVSVVSEILSVTSSGQVYDTSDLKSIRASVGHLPLPKAVLEMYMDLMAECELFMKVGSEYVRL
jgi:hypothetical protein